jgi:formate dehydrogenase alpha subunit
VAGLVATLGSGAMTNSMADIVDANVILVIGSNTTEAHPIVALRIKEAVRKKGAFLIVADPRSIELSKWATIHIKQRPGSDVALLNGFMHVILKEALEDRDFIEKRTEGFHELKEVVEKYNPERVEEITGVPKEKIMKAARMFADGKTGAIFYAMGITQHITGTDNVKAVADLALLTGNLGKPGGGVNPLRGQNNVQGACDMGCLPNVFPGYQSVEDMEVRKKFERAWKTSLPPKSGLTVLEMIEGIEKGKIKAMYIMGENPLLSDPDIAHVRQALDKLEFLVVQDIFMTETGNLADVVLPGAAFAEKDGTFTNTERRIQRVRKAFPPPGESQPDWQIIQALSTAMGHEMYYAHPGKIMDEIATLTPIYGGIDYERIEKNGLQWPCLDYEHPGTPILHVERFPKGKARFIPVEFIPPAEGIDEEFPFILTTGRMLFHFHTGTMTRRSTGLNEVCPNAYVEINIEDARPLSLRNGSLVRVISRRGSVALEARVTERISKGVVFIPFHFREAAANLLTVSRYDPIAKIPEYKVCAVRIEPIEMGGEK